MGNEISVFYIVNNLLYRLYFLKITGSVINWYGIFILKNSKKSRAPPSDLELREF